MRHMTFSTSIASNLTAYLCALLLSLSASGCVIEVDGSSDLHGGMCLDQSCTTTCQGGVCDTVCSTDSCVPSGSAVVGSCQGMCGMMVEGASCQCDAACVDNDDCCIDFEPMCIATSVEGTSGVIITRTSSPNSAPDSGDDGPSCAGRCGTYDSAAACQCDEQCAAQGDCCADIGAVCQASTGGGEGTSAASTNHTAGADSCQERCGEYSKEATCQCDDKCAENDDCCADLKAVCEAP